MGALDLKVVILGGASGVGAGLAESLHARGAEILVADRATIAEPRWKTVAIDLLDTLGLEGLARRVASELGSVDWVVCTVGGIDAKPLLAIESKRWRWMLDANLVAVADSVAALAGSVRAGGKIILAGSGSGFVGPDAGTDLGAYSVAKHALLGYFRALREELRPRDVDAVLMLPSAVEGRLAQSSAGVRHEDGVDRVAEVRGAQSAARTLVNARDAADTMIAQILEGRTIVSNDPEKMHRLLRAGYEELDAGFRRRPAA